MRNLDVNCCGQGLVDVGLLAAAKWTPSEIPKREPPAREGGNAPCSSTKP